MLLVLAKKSVTNWFEYQRYNRTQPAYIYIIRLDLLHDTWHLLPLYLSYHNDSFIVKKCLGKIFHSLMPSTSQPVFLKESNWFMESILCFLSIDSMLILSLILTLHRVPSIVFWAFCRVTKPFAFFASPLS
jgi:hypothetical protein